MKKPTTSGQKTTSHQKRAREIDCNIVLYVPFVVPGLSTSSTTTPTPTSSSSSSQDSTLADTPKIQYTKEVEVRVRSYGETRCRDQKKPKTKIKMKDAKKYKAINYMNCRNGCRSSERIWSMNVVFQSHGENLSLDIEALPVLLMNYQWSREQKWNRFRVSIVSRRTFRRTQIAISVNCDICLRTQITRASCRRRTCTVVPRVENFGGLISADHKLLSEGSESRDNHRCALVVQDLTTHVDTILPM